MRLRALDKAGNEHSLLYALQEEHIHLIITLVEAQQEFFASSAETLSKLSKELRR